MNDDNRDNAISYSYRTHFNTRNSQQQNGHKLKKWANQQNKPTNCIGQPRLPASSGVYLR